MNIIWQLSSSDSSWQLLVWSHLEKNQRTNNNFKFKLTVLLPFLDINAKSIITGKFFIIASCEHYLSLRRFSVTEIRGHSTRFSIKYIFFNQMDLIIHFYLKSNVLRPKSKDSSEDKEVATLVLSFLSYHSHFSRFWMV